MEFSVVFVFVATSAFFQIDLVTSDYVMPVPGDCTKYQVCDYSGCFVFNCGIGTEFNPKVLVCDYPLRDRGACGIRDYNIGPTIPYPGRAISSYPNQQPANPGYPGYPGNSGYPGSGSPNPAPPIQTSGYPKNSGYTGSGSPNPAPPIQGSGYPGNSGNPGSGSPNPCPPGCPASCG